MMVAWVSTPGYTAVKGVARRSLSPAALVPMKAILPFKSAGSALPSRISTALMYGNMLPPPR